VSGRLSASAALLLGEGTALTNRNTMGEPQGQSGLCPFTGVRILLLSALDRTVGRGDVICNSAWSHITRHMTEMAFHLFRDRSMFRPIMYCSIMLSQLMD
jgi:hypothetical protein